MSRLRRLLWFIPALLLACNPYATAWRTTASVRAAGTLAGRSIDAALKERIVHCQGEKQRECVQASKEFAAAQSFLKYGKPAIDTAILTSVTAIDLAEQADSKINIWSYLSPAVCYLAKAVENWGDLLGKSKVQILAICRLAKGVTCP